MADLAEQTDVESALGRELTEAEEARVASLLAEASALIVGHLGNDPSDPGPIPDPVTLVAARMVARVLGQNAAVGVEGTTEQAGPFSQTVRLGSGTTTGAPWLTAVDKVTLRPYRTGGGFRSVPLESEFSGKFRTYD